MIKILEPIDIKPLIDSYNALESGMQWSNYGVKGNRQVGLQYKEDDDPWTSAVGKSKGNDLSYNKLNPFFKDTIFETLINKYNFKRTRLMWVGPFACYSMHNDETPRVHIPLITNPDCYFVFKHGMISNLSIGYVWRVDTRRRHTFMNCSEQPRLHLVGVVES